MILYYVYLIFFQQLQFQQKAIAHIWPIWKGLWEWHCKISHGSCLEAVIQCYWCHNKDGKIVSWYRRGLLDKTCILSSHGCHLVKSIAKMKP